MNQQLLDTVVTVIVCLFGSGGIVIFALNRIAARIDARDETKKDIREIKDSIRSIEKGLVLALQNDKVIFNALRTHEINGDSEDQERKMDSYLLSLLDEEV